MRLLRDTWLLFQRQLLLMWRTPMWLFFAIAQPVTYLFLFTPFLQKALAPMGAQSISDVYNIYVPGLLVVMCFYTGLFAGFGLLAEVRMGILERARVTPVSRSALLLGRAARDVASMLVQCALITAISFPFGLTVPLPNLLVAYVLLTVIGLMATAISYDIALTIKNEGALGSLLNTIGQPIALLAGVLLPLAIAPTWIQQLALLNPFSWATNSVRALFWGQLSDPVIWQGAAIVSVLAVLTVVLSTRLYSRNIR
ncbi:transport permease protein [Catellatospora sp. TT07R-123]|uniref:ABC transporter permease n=1 Tax=Catellatospora sp. TT07R-123 TaxID=2733863 RepID=UPI001B14DB3B|nr:ABC transporter permease [Catellatospora sp. TT07R-123]GHJ47723.1 transport permease protein [Catellatospora sp. TT07R-123]